MVQAALLLTLSAFGAAGLYLALAGARRRASRLALLLLAAAGAALVGLTAPLLAGGATRGWFAVLSLVGVIGAVRMITHTRPVYSALYFILVVVAVTGLLVLMQAEFVAAALLIIYAGAILVTYVFVIMLAQQSGPAPYDREPREPFLGCLFGFVLLAVIALRLFVGPEAGGATLPAGSATEGTVRGVGTLLLTNYVIAVQLAGVLLLAALVGAIAIARRKATPADEGEAD
jgi:NADH-quinone oxidoreductase subunit J